MFTTCTSTVLLHPLHRMESSWVSLVLGECSSQRLGLLQPALPPASAKPVNDDGDEGCQSKGGPKGMEQGAVSSMKEQPCATPVAAQIGPWCGGVEGLGWGRCTSPVTCICLFHPQTALQRYRTRCTEKKKCTDRGSAGRGSWAQLRTRQGG